MPAISSIDANGQPTWWTNPAPRPQAPQTPNTAGFYRPLPGGGFPYASPGQLPPQFTQQAPTWQGRMGGGGGGGGVSRYSPMSGQQQQQNPFPFDLPSILGLGNFYTPHNIGDAQNVPYQGPMANFIGSQWGQQPGQGTSSPMQTGQPLNRNLWAYRGRM